jgi:S-adenosylmethionine:tRNA ribosyltransferase-isomerase
VHLSDFDYELPPELIAQEPLPERDASRLLVLNRATGAMSHHVFRELPEFLHAGDCLVQNDTRVIPARLLGTRKGSTKPVEILLTRPVGGAADPAGYEAMVRPARKLHPGAVVLVGTSRVEVEIVESIDARRRIVRFPPDFEIAAFLEKEGHVPLPPYIERQDAPADKERYQTVYAETAGAVAAPTAGLHFTPDLQRELETRGVFVARVTLHVGPGTFLPVTQEDPSQHKMDREFYSISSSAAYAIGRTRRSGGRIVAVGTTVVRALETAAREEDGLWGVSADEGWTEAFIYPPYPFRIVDALITNFHLPRSTLLMLVSAFAGREKILAAYREAVSQRYRFYSYGDAMLVQ